MNSTKRLLTRWGGPTPHIHAHTGVRGVGQQLPWLNGRRGAGQYGTPSLSGLLWPGRASSVRRTTTRVPCLPCGCSPVALYLRGSTVECVRTVLLASVLFGRGRLASCVPVHTVFCLFVLAARTASGGHRPRDMTQRRPTQLQFSFPLCTSFFFPNLPRDQMMEPETAVTNIKI